MSLITIVPSTASHGSLQPIVLTHPTPAQLAEVVGTLRSNGIPYSISYGQTRSSSFRYPVAPRYVSR